MKTLLLTFLLLPFSLFAQTIPVDKVTGTIFYAEEVLVKDGPQTDLYHRAKTWLHGFNKGMAQPALSVDDASNGILIGNKYTLVSVLAGNRKDIYKLWFTLQLKMDDDRYYYRLDNFQMQKLNTWSATASKKKPAQIYPLEEVLISKNTLDKNGIKKPYYKFLESQCHETISSLIKDLKVNML